MTRTISGMHIEKFGRLVADLGIRFAQYKCLTNEEEDGLIDIILNENVIMKSYGDGSLTLDLGGNLATVEANEYFTITLE